MRLREYSETIPKPMVKIGYRPILWNVMKYYAHFGHRDFILCLGYQANVIKDYFLNYDECISNDFKLSHGGRQISLLNRDIEDWNITFVDTGINSSIGERLRAVQPHLEGESTFLANYSDGLSDLPLDGLIDFHHQQDSVATLLSVRPSQTFHTVVQDEQGRVQQLRAVSESGLWLNAGFYVLQQEIFDFMEEGDDLVERPFQRLMERDALYAYRYNGFFGCMDTYKEKQLLEDMYQNGNRPWEVWMAPEHGSGVESVAPHSAESYPPIAGEQQLPPVSHDVPQKPSFSADAKPKQVAAPTNHHDHAAISFDRPTWIREG